MSELELLQTKLDEIKALTVISIKNALTVEEAALYLGLTTEYVRKMAKTRKIKSYRSKSGRGIYLHKKDLDKWMLATEVRSEEQIQEEVNKRIYL